MQVVKFQPLAGPPTASVLSIGSTPRLQSNVHSVCGSPLKLQVSESGPHTLVAMSEPGSPLTSAVGALV